MWVMLQTKSQHLNTDLGISLLVLSGMNSCLWRQLTDSEKHVQLYKNFNFHILEHFEKKELVLHAVVDWVQQNQGENLKCIAVTVQQQYQNAPVWSPSEV
jgi:hypothetical protein